MKKVLIAAVFLLLAWSCNPVSGSKGQNAGNGDSLFVFYDSKGKPEPGAMYPRIIQLEHYEAGKGNILSTILVPKSLGSPHFSPSSENLQYTG